MSRLNVWVPDELADQTRAARLNVSALTQAAIREKLSAHATGAWLATLPILRGISRPDLAPKAA